MTKYGQATDPDFIASAEAAALIGWSRRTFNRRVAAGQIKPAVVLPGRTGARLFLRSDIERLAEEPAA